MKNKYIMRCDYTEKFWSGREENKTVLFDLRDYTKEQIYDMIRNGKVEKVNNVIICDTENYERVFRSLLKKEV